MLSFAKKYNNIDYDICGKLIVATEKNELPIIHNIYKRGLKNGLKGLKILSPEEILKVEYIVAGY